MLTALQQVFQSSNKYFVEVRDTSAARAAPFETGISRLHATEFLFYTPADRLVTQP
jgi:hypothetical protein